MKIRCEWITGYWETAVNVPKLAHSPKVDVFRPAGAGHGRR